MIDIDHPATWCGLVNVYIDGVDVGKLVKYFMDKHRLFVIPIKHEEFQGIRVTPNIYTLLSEVDLFADVMEKAALGKIKEVMS